MVRRLASRHSAKASIRRSSRSSPSTARLRSSSERARRAASSSASSSGSSWLTAAATARWRLISRSFGSKSLVRLDMDLGYREAGEPKPRPIESQRPHPAELATRAEPPSPAAPPGHAEAWPASPASGEYNGQAARRTWEGLVRLQAGPKNLSCRLFPPNRQYAGRLSESGQNPRRGRRGSSDRPTAAPRSHLRSISVAASFGSFPAQSTGLNPARHAEGRGLATPPASGWSVSL